MTRTATSLVLSCILAIPAFAQEEEGGVNAHGFTLAAHDGDPRDLMTVVRPGTFHENDFFISGVFEYAEQPLVRVVRSEFGTDEIRTVYLDNLYALNISAGYATLEHLRFDVSGPLFFSSLGPREAAQGFDIGDPRISALAAII